MSMNIAPSTPVRGQGKPQTAVPSLAHKVKGIGSPHSLCDMARCLVSNRLTPPSVGGFDFIEA